MIKITNKISLDEYIEAISDAVIMYGFRICKKCGRSSVAIKRDGSDDNNNIGYYYYNDIVDCSEHSLSDLIIGNTEALTNLYERRN